MNYSEIPPEDDLSILIEQLKLGREHGVFTRNESTIYLALDEQDKGIGFTQLYPLFSSTRIGRLWLLNDLFVKPAHRGRGISILLIERAKKLARETKALGIILETEKTNKIGNQLYPRADFILEDDTNHYFWKNE